MELLAGAREDRHLHDLRRLLARRDSLDDRARLRGRGVAVSHVPDDRCNGPTHDDCLIAAVAIRADVAILHNDPISMSSRAAPTCKS
jgi:predicted nucleic acid-binding protein